MRIGLIGLGAIGTPIAHKLFKKYGKDFCLIASEDIKKMLLSKDIIVNGEVIAPNIYSDRDKERPFVDLLMTRLFSLTSR